jgi:hypothetical protein
MTNDEDKADERMTNGSRTRVFQRKKKIHDALRVQHSKWVEPISLRIAAGGAPESLFTQEAT